MYTEVLLVSWIYNAYSDIGDREKNEDRCDVRLVEDSLFAVLADGMGGFRGGEIASALVISTFEEMFAHGRAQDLDQVLKTANEKILERQQELGFKMKTTAAAVCITDDSAVTAHVGDSRVYAFSRGQLVFRTTDHSAAQMCVDMGEITEEGIREHPDRCVLTRSLGSGEDIKVDVHKLEKGSFDSLLICSDGFWGNVYEQEMCDALAQAQAPLEWIEKMLEKRRQRTKDDNDNNTAVAIMYGREG